MGSMAPILADAIVGLFSWFAYSTLARPEIRRQLDEHVCWVASCNGMRLDLARRTWMGDRANRLGWVECESRSDTRFESGTVWSRLAGDGDFVQYDSDGVIFRGIR